MRVDEFELRSKVVLWAKEFLGQREISGNKGFHDPVFQKLLSAYGWNEGEAWCCHVRNMILVEAIGYKEGLSEGAVKTVSNLRALGIELKKVPEVGDIVSWQKYENGKKTWKGHTGIVSEVRDDYFMALEGNTNEKGSREGTTFLEKVRTYDWDVKNGLRLMGFQSIYG